MTAPDTSPPVGDVTGSFTEITLCSGERHRVAGDIKQIEQLILDAARGSLLQFVWLSGTHSEPLAINPAHVVTLRPSGPPGD